nr:FAD-binding oxidoreductase [Acetobacter conturbans]
MSVLVIGGGIVGLCCAWDLLRRGASVTLVDDGTPVHSASWGNAGHIAVEQVTPLASRSVLLSAPARLFPITGGPLDLVWKQPGSWLPWFVSYLSFCTSRSEKAGQAALQGLLADALDAWRHLLAGLNANDLLRVDGHYMVWGQPSDATRRKMHKALAVPTGTATRRPMTLAECEEVQTTYGYLPALGIKFSGPGRLSPPGKVLDVLRDALRAHGQIVTGRVLRVSSADGRAGVHLDDGRVLEADRVLVAAGARSSEILPEYTRYLIAERGYHIEWDHGGVPSAPPVVFSDHSTIVSCMGDRMRASTFVEFGKWDTPPDISKWEHLETFVRSAGFPIRSGFSRWMGARPTTPDYLPMLGPVPHRPGVFAAFGHQHLGLTLAAVTASAMASLIMGQAIGRDLRPFEPARFRTRQSHA